jgi:hypothetical protein
VKTEFLGTKKNMGQQAADCLYETLGAHSRPLVRGRLTLHETG